MLPSMPVLFTRDSQDAFGNRIEPNTSFFNQNTFIKPIIKPNPPPPKIAEPVVPVEESPKDVKLKGNLKKKEEPPKFDNNALETALVKSYYNKVQSRFSAHQANNKFIQFQNILKTFDPSKETPVELYRKLEELFGEEHKDFLEDFLLFLKPGQAAKVGRFMDHFMLVQISGFIQHLHSTFNRKPTVLRKILRALTNGINSGNSAEMKTRVLPHLRSNPRLIQMFKSLFPDERPLDSAYETGVDMLPESFLTADHGYEMWEFQEETDNMKKIDATEGLDTMYLHGRVFLQHGRLLRSASVTYPYSKEPYRVHTRRLAPAHCHLSPPESDEERSSPKRSRISAKIPSKKSKKQLKSPTKNVKDVNDNTKVTNALSSPKTVKNKTQNKKSAKDKKDDLKPDTQKKKESKSPAFQKTEVSKPKQVKPEVPVGTDIKTEVKSVTPVSWTRDEDKTMLQVLKLEAGSELVFGKIRKLLPHRSVTEIRERYCHVMTLLQQMAVGEVT